MVSTRPPIVSTCWRIESISGSTSRSIAIALGFLSDYQASRVVSKILSDELAALQCSVLHFGSMVEEQLAEASIALAWRDADRARKVTENDASLDSEEVEIEEHCIELLARHQPVASDLRLIAACLKINNDLERIGDLAASIAERVGDLQLPPPEEIRTTLEELGRRSRRMLRRAIDSFAVRDAAGAKRVLMSDDAVDALNRQVIL